MTSASVSESSPSPAAADSGLTFLARLGRRVESVRTTLCLGIDPDPESLPDGWPRDISGVERMANLLLDAALPRAAAVKINVAFFEAFGSAGIAALERVRARIPDDVPFIADAKRGDIGTTVARQATALFDVLDAHAVTASPYLGGEAIAALLERSDRFVYVLCRTSNPGAGELQNLIVDGQPLYLHVAQRAALWAADRANVGLVVGATAPAELDRIRDTVPELAFLVPGRWRTGRRHRCGQDVRPGHGGPVRLYSRRRPARQCLTWHRRRGPGQCRPRDGCRGRRHTLGSQSPVLG